MGKHGLSFPEWKSCHNFWLLALLGALWEALNLLEAAQEAPRSAKACSGWSHGGSPEHVSYDLRAFQQYPASFLWQLLWQGCCPEQDLGRWACSSESGAEGNTVVLPTGICLFWEDVTPFLCDIHTSLLPISCFTKTFTSTCWKDNEVWILKCDNFLENFTWS